MKRAGFALLLALGSTGSALAYVRSSPAGGETPTFVRWPSNTQTYLINAQTSDSLPNVADGSDPVQAVARGFQAWEDVVPSAINLNFGGFTGSTTAGSPGNVVSFVDTTFAFNGALAATIVTTSLASGRRDIVDADLVFNPAIEWATSDLTASQYDVQAVATHEVGHFIGLSHSGVMSATMFARSGAQAQIDRFLDPDDIAGAAEIYPEDRLDRDYGRIAGFVKRAGDAVFMSHVVAVDGDGRAVVSALTLKNGSFEMVGVPPGSYLMYVEPLDGPFYETDVTSAYWQPTLPAISSTLVGPFDVDAGGITSVGTIHAPEFDANAPVAVEIGRQPVTSEDLGLEGLTATVEQGDADSWYVVVGCDNCIDPTTFQILGPGVTPVGDFTYGKTSEYPIRRWVRRRFDFAPDAKATPRTIVLHQGSFGSLHTEYLAGALEILPKPARLHVAKDGLFPNAVYVSWYGAPRTFELGRDTQREFVDPVPLDSANDLGFVDFGVLLDEGNYFYRIDD